jgi:hypothetical protein
MPAITNETNDFDGLYHCATCDLIFSFSHAQAHSRDKGHVISKETMENLGIIEWIPESVHQ